MNLLLIKMISLRELLDSHQREVSLTVFADRSIRLLYQVLKIIFVVLERLKLSIPKAHDPKSCLYINSNTGLIKIFNMFYISYLLLYIKNRNIFISNITNNFLVPYKLSCGLFTPNYLRLLQFFNVYL